MTYNTLTEPWIKVKTNTKTTVVSVLDFFKNASEYTDVLNQTNLHMNRFAVIRFLIAFIADAYRITDEDDLIDLQEEGSFDMEVINDYIEKCKKEGCSFDLFDNKQPFLMDVDFKKKDETGIPVGSISPEYKTGRTDTFYLTVEESENADGYSKIENSCKLTYPQFVYNLFGNRCCFVSSSANYSSSVNAGRYATPYYFLVKKKNMFETIIRNIPCIEDENDLPLWRSEQVPNGFLGFAFTKQQKIKILQSDETYVYRLQMEAMPKMDLSGLREIWMNKDPFIAIRTKDDKRSVYMHLYPDENAWHELAKISGFKNPYLITPNIAIQNTELDKTNEPFELELFSYTIKKKKDQSNLTPFASQTNNVYSVPQQIIKSPAKIALLDNMVGQVSRNAGYLYKTINEFYKDIRNSDEIKQTNAALDARISYEKTMEYMISEPQNQNNFLSIIENMSLTELSEKEQDFYKIIRQATYQEFERFKGRNRIKFYTYMCRLKERVHGLEADKAAVL